MNAPRPSLGKLAAARRRLLLGDKVEMVAKPIAVMLDQHLGTDLQNCGGCGNRKAWLNGEPVK